MDQTSKSEITLTKHKTPTNRGWVIASAVASTFALLVCIFRWQLVQLLTVFMEPFLEMLAFATLIVVTISCLIHAWRPSRRANPRSWLPFVVCAAAAAIVVFVPFDAIYLKANFRLMQARRAEVAKGVIAGKTGIVTNHTVSCGDLLKLSEPDHSLSDDGEIAIDYRDGKPSVLFFTFRGILERFSGYVYSPTDEPPEKTEFCGDGREVERVAPNWFWYAS